MSPEPTDPILTMVLHPLTWLVLLVVWIWFWQKSRAFPRIYPSFDKKRNVPGDYVADGSTATSKMEMRVRATLIAAGYRPLPQGTGLCVPGKTATESRKLTPDIIIHAPKKVIIEVDPLFWHGREGPHKVYEDIERNKQYTRLGFAVIRVRIGWKGDPHAKLSPNDMVTEQGDFYPDKHGTELYERVRKARVVNTRYWDRELAKLTPLNEMHKQSRRKPGPGGQTPGQAYPAPPGQGW